MIESTTNQSIGSLNLVCHSAVTRLYVETPPQYSFSVLGTDGTTVVKVRPDGSVEFGEGVSMDEASRAFWEGLKAAGFTEQQKQEAAAEKIREAAKTLFVSLERALRASLGGHPIGHDTVVFAKRSLKRAYEAGISSQPPHLTCNCTPCAIGRRSLKGSAADSD